MLIGYARTSTVDQQYSLAAQVEELEGAGCERVFQETVSSVDVAHREQLEAALDYARDGDVLVVTKLDRLARSTAHLFEVAERLHAKGAAMKILDLNIDTSSATGELILTVMGGIATFERRIMLERQREGIAKAKAEGKYKGRKPTARAQADKVRDLHRQGFGGTAIAKELGIGRSSVYRILGEQAQKR